MNYEELRELERLSGELEKFKNIIISKRKRKR